LIEHELVEYICTEIAYDRVERLAPDDPLLDGALDSLGVLGLAVFVEARSSVTIEGEDLVPENFATVAAVASPERSAVSPVTSCGRERPLTRCGCESGAGVGARVPVG